MAFNSLVNFVLRRQDSCKFDVVLEHDFIVGFVRFFVALNLLVVRECLLQEEHAFSLIVVATHFSVLSG